MKLRRDLRGLLSVAALLPVDSSSGSYSGSSDAVRLSLLVYFDRANELEPEPEPESTENSGEPTEQNSIPETQSAEEPASETIET